MKNRGTTYLSRAERLAGGRYFLRFTAFNGLGVSFLGDSVATLLAIHFGAGNTELGLISAMLFISGIVLLWVPRIFRGRKIVPVAFWAWFIRGMVALSYGTLLFLEGKTAVVVIIVSYAIFCLSRTVGMAMVNTIQKHLTVRRTESDLIFRNSMSFQGTRSLSRFVSFFILSLKSLSDLTGMLILPFIGMVSNFIAALNLRRVPSRARVDYRKGENLFGIFLQYMRSAQKRRILFLRWIALGQIILFGMSLPLLRRSTGLSIAQLFLFTFSMSLAAFLSSISLRPIAARAGSRPILFFSSLFLAPLLVFWAFTGSDISLGGYAIVGFFSSFFLNTSNVAASRLLLLITPVDGGVGFNSMETFFSSILALILGLSAGFLADLSEQLSQSLPINDFGLVFIFAAAGAILHVIVTVRVEEPGSMELAETVRIISNIGNLRTWQTVANLENTADPVKRKTLVQSVNHSRAPVATLEIKKILAEPLSRDKADIIDALFLTRRPEFVQYLCDEASNSASYYRENAIFALGSYSDDAARNVLDTLLKDGEARIRACAAKSLGRLKFNDRLDDVMQLWKNESRIHERIDYMIALFHMDPEHRYIFDLFSPKIASDKQEVERTMYTLLAQQFGMVPPLGFLYRDEHIRYGEGVALLLEEARETGFLLQHGDTLTDLWDKKDYRTVWEICHEALKQADPPPAISVLKEAMSMFPTELSDSANALAGLYFSYQLLTAN